MPRASVKTPVPDEAVPPADGPELAEGTGGASLEPPQPGADADGFGGDAPTPAGQGDDTAPDEAVPPAEEKPKSSRRRKADDAPVVVVAATFFLWRDADGHKRRARKGDVVIGVPTDALERGLRNGTLAQQD